MGEFKSFYKNEYKMNGLTCANCTKKIIKELEKISYKDVEYNFATETMMFYSVDEQDKTKSIQKLVDSIEDGVSVENLFLKADDLEKEGECETSSYRKTEPRLLRIGLGIVALFSMIAFEHLIQIPKNYIWVIAIILYFFTAKGIMLKAIKSLSNIFSLDENFLMTVATLGAIGLGQYTEAFAVLVFYEIGEYMQSKAVASSRAEIKALIEKKIGLVHVYRNGEISDEKAEAIKLGEKIILRPGEMLSCDSVLESEVGIFDTSAINGEYKPIAIKEGSQIPAGFIALESAYRLTVQKTYVDSSINKITQMSMESASKKARTEKLISKFASFYTPIVVLAAFLIAILGPFVSKLPFSVWGYRSLVFLVISCPCAIVLSVPLSFFASLGKASKNGILIKGANYLEVIRNVDYFIFDKTGTLSKGSFAVKEIATIGNYSKEKILHLAASSERHSNHPIAKSIIQSELDINGCSDCDCCFKDENDDFKEERSMGVSFENKLGNIKVGKFNFCSEKLEEGKSNLGFSLDLSDTIIYISVNGKIEGAISLGDTLKEEASSLMSFLKQKNIKTAISTGDGKGVSEKFALNLGVDELKFELLPEEKLRFLEEKLEKNYSVAFVGDGINDAPVLARSDLGISMGIKGSDIALESADIIIMDDNLSKIKDLFDIADRTFFILWQNIIFALVIKLAFFTLAIFGLSTMWFAVFADVGVTILTVINTLRLLK